MKLAGPIVESFPEILNYRDGGKFAAETGSDPTEARQETVFG